MIRRFATITVIIAFAITFAFATAFAFAAPRQLASTNSPLPPPTASSDHTYNVMVIICTIDSCPQCEIFNKHYPKIRDANPTTFFGFSKNGKPATQLCRANQAPVPYRGQRLRVAGYPKFIIYSGKPGQRNPYLERFRMTGFTADSRETLEYLIGKAGS